MSEGTRAERTFEGLGVSPGIGIGVALVREGRLIDVPEYRIPAAKVESEQKRLKDAISAARRQIGRLRTRARAKTKGLTGITADEVGDILDAYFHILKSSRLVRGAHKRIANERINAEAAVQSQVADLAEGFQRMNDPYLAARAGDVQEVGNRLLRHLMRTPVKPFSTAPKGSIIVTEELTPADTAQINPDRIAGIATAVGGRQSHTAIMARAIGVPAVLGAPGLMGTVRPGDQILVDGELGQIIVNPSSERVAAFKSRRVERLRRQRRLDRLTKRPAITRDGARITLQANVELPMEMNAVNQTGAAGIGLLRSEYMFMNRTAIPSEDEQYEALRDIIERTEGHAVTIRTLDLGGDKGAALLTSEFKDSAESPLGIRGIRLSLARTDIFETQCRAILRSGAHGRVRILLPMVTTVAEIRQAREVLARAARRLHRRGADIPAALPQVGVMIEVPGAALSADALARASDFFAIGSNDLTMFTLAIDRADEQVAHLYDPLHPAVLRLIQFSAAAALRARIPVSICGEIAGDPRFTALLLGLGFRELSMTPHNIPRVKERIRQLDLVAADRRARIIMDQVDPARIKGLLDEFNREL